MTHQTEQQQQQTLAYFITDHGFGHAARSCELIHQLLVMYPHIHIIIVTMVPQWFLHERISHNSNNNNNNQNGKSETARIQIWPIQVDVGVLQNVTSVCTKDNNNHDSNNNSKELVVNMGQTICELVKFWLDEPVMEQKISGIIRELNSRHHNISAIIYDITPLAPLVAQRMNIPSIAISNFAWNWLYSDWLTHDISGNSNLDYFHTQNLSCELREQLTRVIQLQTSAYARSSMFIKLPYCARNIPGLSSDGVVQFDLESWLSGVHVSSSSSSSSSPCVSSLSSKSKSKSLLSSKNNGVYSLKNAGDIGDENGGGNDIRADNENDEEEEEMLAQRALKQKRRAILEKMFPNRTIIDNDDDNDEFESMRFMLFSFGGGRELQQTMIDDRYIEQWWSQESIPKNWKVILNLESEQEKEHATLLFFSHDKLTKSAISMIDVMSVVDVICCKTGYGIVSEILALTAAQSEQSQRHDSMLKGVLYTDRPGFCEHFLLESALLDALGHDRCKYVQMTRDVLQASENLFQSAQSIVDSYESSRQSIRRSSSSTSPSTFNVSTGDNSQQTSFNTLGGKHCSQRFDGGQKAASVIMNFITSTTANPTNQGVCADDGNKTTTGLQQ